MKEQLEKELNLLVFLHKMVPDCIIARGMEPTYIVVCKGVCGESAGLGGIIDCPNIHRVIKNKNHNWMKPMDILNILDGEHERKYGNE